MQELVATFLPGAVGSILTGLTAIIMWRLQKKKYEADVDRVEAETHKVEAEVADLTSARLIKELDRLSASNESLSRLVDTQRAEINTLRGEIIQYAAREMNHAAEVQALRNEIERLQAPKIHPLGEVLEAAFPVKIPHTRNEFDDESTTDQNSKK